MPLDYYGDDEDVKESGSTKGSRKDFDCPECNANNPLEEALADGQELLCNYCGCEFLVKATDSGRFKFKEL
jgi:DNA-directed RNA polymerase subunit RPC12/RpoP